MKVLKFISQEGNIVQEALDSTCIFKRHLNLQLVLMHQIVIFDKLFDHRYTISLNVCSETSWLCLQGMYCDFLDTAMRVFFIYFRYFEEKEISEQG